jgi:NADH-quinone oxidoreductase subunit H
MGFALFFLAEYGSIILMSLLSILVFLGGWVFIPLKLLWFLDPFILGFKTSFILFFFIWIRASFPRYRVDQLMRLCWKLFLPLSFSFVLFFVFLIFCLNGIF